MSEKVGPTSIKQWLYFEKALQFHANAEDWQALEKVNAKMISALTAAGKPSNRQQLLARKSLAAVHQAVVKQLAQAKAKLAIEMSQFQQQQDGLAAYQLTQLSGEDYD
ncbi:hypothetical protein [Shewanella sp. 10N.286.54.B9]|uniref:hypothetical protein n=1 Tax=Shewanella sp. 10N.286.54.B9 TaxID=3229719 RepID=UPI00355426E9